MQRMDSINSNNLPFMKMHGLGNDFVVIDAREGEVALSKKIISGIADRHFGVGFDQCIFLRFDFIGYYVT